VQTSVPQEEVVQQNKNKAVCARAWVGGTGQAATLESEERMHL